MDPFSECILRPLCHAARPDVIVQIGRGEEETTRKLLSYCEERGGRLHLVDTSGSRSSEERDSDSLTLHRRLALNAIPLIERMDLVLIDDDPNWFTIRNGLELIEKQSADSDLEFPIVVVRGTGGLHGRRDGYRDTTIIPSAFLKETRIDRTVTSLQVAIEQGGKRNGVLTGIEDFLKETSLSLKLTRIHGFGGIAVLSGPRRGAPQGAVRKFLKAISSTPELARWIHNLEKAREESESSQRSASRRLERLRDRLRPRLVSGRNARLASRDAVQEKDEALRNLTLRLRSREVELEATRAELRGREKVIDRMKKAGSVERKSLRDQIEARSRRARKYESDLEARTRELQENKEDLRRVEELRQQTEEALRLTRSELSSVQERLTHSQDDLESLRHRIDSLETGESGSSGIDRLREMLTDRERALSIQGARLTVLTHECSKLEEDLAIVLDWFDKMGDSATKLLRSTPQVVGSRIREFQSKLLMRKPKETPADSVSHLLGRYRQWRGVRAKGIEVVHLRDRAQAVHIPRDAEQVAAGIILFDPSSSAFHFKYALADGPPDESFRLQPAQDSVVPIAGDWLGTGTISIGCYDPKSSTFHIKDRPGGGAMDVEIRFGSPDCAAIPIVGDWTGEGRDSIGLYDPERSRFLLRHSLSSGPSDSEIRFGPTKCAWIPVIGNWNGERRSSVGLYDPMESRFHLRHLSDTGSTDEVVRFGTANAGFVPVVGDWSGQGHDGIGVYDPARGEFHLRYSAQGGKADLSFRIQIDGESLIPLAGRWG